MLPIAGKETRPSSKGPFLRSPLFDVLQFLCLLSVLFWLAFKSMNNSGYHWQWYKIPNFIYTYGDQGFQSGPLLDGLIITLKISGISLILAFIIGLVTAFFRLSDSRIASGLARLYLELIRNTPLLIQIFFIYFVLGPVIGLERFSAAVLALALFEGAYASEILRSGIISINKGQHEASYSLGLSSYRTYRHVILPQAIRNMLPPLVSQAISLVKDSSLVSTIAIYDLTMQANALVAETFLTFEIWFTVAAMYLVITVILSFSISIMERKLKRT